MNKEQLITQHAEFLAETIRVSLQHLMLSGLHEFDRVRDAWIPVSTPPEINPDLGRSTYVLVSTGTEVEIAALWSAESGNPPGWFPRAWETHDITPGVLKWKPLPEA